MKVAGIVLGGLVLGVVLLGVLFFVVLRSSVGDQSTLVQPVDLELVSTRQVEAGSTRTIVDVELTVSYTADGRDWNGTWRIPASRGVPDPLRGCVDPDDPTRFAVVEVEGAACGEAVAPTVNRAEPA